MQIRYDDKNDMLVVHLTDKPIAKEASQGWNTQISYAEEGSVVEVVILDGD